MSLLSSSLKSLHTFFIFWMLGSGLAAQTQNDADPSGPVAQSLADPTATINHQLSSRLEQSGIHPAANCSDQTFIRRVYLDLAGRVPTQDERHQFMDDCSSEKRQQLIESLLGSEDHARHFADLFDALLMGRADESAYDQRVRHGWRDYLVNVFAKNRPWNEVAEEILLARPTHSDQTGAVWFLYERKNQHQAIAEAVAPAFFGIRIECAQCHDHMMVDEIRQEHYWGLVAFFNRGQNRKASSGLQIDESAIGGFSEFADLTGSSSPNHLSFLGAELVAEPRPTKDEKQQDDDDLYEPSDDKDALRVPRFSRRKAFVEQVLRDHPLLAQAMVNRVWAILMGRGLVHPHDEIDSMHPPSHPELLESLSRDFRASGYDVRRLIKSIASADAYQFQSVAPKDVNDPSTFAWYIERPLVAEQLARSMDIALRGESKAEGDSVKYFRQQFVKVLPDTVQTELAEALYLSNSPQVDQLIRSEDGPHPLLKQLSALNSNQDIADILFERVLQRPPRPDEVSAISDYLSDREDRRKQALTEIIWSLLAGAEFRLNH